MTSTLISTLGGQAQVVTFALDDLLTRGENVRDVIVLHLAPQDPRQQRALAQLESEFAHDRYIDRPCRLRRWPIRRGTQPLLRISDEAAAEATWQTVHELLIQLKSNSQHLNLCVAGGPRLIALMAMSAASLLFDHHDRLWHMYTPPDFLERAREGTILHAQPEDGVRLIQVPLAPWGAYFPALRSLAQATPAQVILAQTEWLEGTERERCQQVVGTLTERQLDTLRAFARGLNPQAAAEALTVSVKTVDAHKTVILDQCRIAWHLPDDEHLTYHFLREKFGRFFPATDER